MKRMLYPYLGQGLLNCLATIVLSLVLNGSAIAASSSQESNSVPIEHDRLQFNILLGVAPFAEKSSAFTKSFSGVGSSAIIGIVPWRNLRMAIEAGTMAQGDAAMSWVGYKYYTSGLFQYSLSESKSDLKHEGIFVEGAIAIYNVVKTNPMLSIDTTYKGFGGNFQYGYERTVWKHFFLSARLGLLSSFGGAANFNGLYTLALVGMPLGI